MQAKRSEQDLAKDLYLSTNLTQQQIADMLDVNRRTVWLWIHNNRWEELRNATRQTPGLIVNDIYNHITAINDRIREREPGDRCPTKEEVESLRKLINMTNSIKKNGPSVYLEAYGEFVAYLMKKDQDLARKISTHMDNYITGTIGDNAFEMRKQRSANVRMVMDNLNRMNEHTMPTAPDHIKNKEDDENVSTCESIPVLQNCGNESICEHDVIMAGAQENNSKAASDLLDREVADALDITIEEVRELSEDVTIDPAELGRIVKLPPHQRPSPLRDGNILWVNDINDVDEYRNNHGEYWGERKMGDIIRRYSDYHKYRPQLQ